MGPLQSKLSAGFSFIASEAAEDDGLLGGLIVLSLARGNPDRLSDIDIMFIHETKNTHFAGRHLGHRIDAGYFTPDIIRTSLANEMEWDFFAYSIMNGLVAYEKKDAVGEIRKHIALRAPFMRKRSRALHYSTGLNFLNKAKEKKRSIDKAENFIYVSGLRFYSYLHHLNGLLREHSHPGPEMPLFLKSPANLREEMSCVLGFPATPDKLMKRAGGLSRLLDDIERGGADPVAPEKEKAKEMPEDKAAAVKALLSSTIKKYGPDIRGMLVVSSHAFGEAEKGSDVDVKFITASLEKRREKNIRGVDFDINFVPLSIIEWSMNDSLWFDNCYNTYFHGITVYSDGTVEKLKKALAERKAGANLETFRYFTSVSSGYLDKCNREIKRDFSSAVRWLYLSAIFAWCSGFPANGSSVREWLPLFERTGTFKNLPPRFASRLGGVIGYTRDKKGIDKKLLALGRLYSWAAHKQKTGCKPGLSC